MLVDGGADAAGAVAGKDQESGLMSIKERH